ncbi:efflux transporter outer membrane subunit [Adhaeribacter swui]|uniref:Efflux transporter outer membrane subunit n=1 Tax=Adhaeribacter swui TaxID=2086471 RepID=A0A7G7G9E7_9BACT|nr:efflux transporter outer membrane subunit [Adhaeribacter swui]QNF33781.1 efflux transporter outer membrane subunit [Adhaeribacter swui]
MYFRNSLYKISLFLFLLAFLGACKATDPLVLPKGKTLPASFGATSDTSSLGQMAWRSFFTDPNLVSLIDTALRNNPDLLAAAQRVDMVRSNVLLAKGALLPGIQGVASAGTTKFGDYTIDGVGNYDTNFSPNIDEKQRIPQKAVPDYFLGFRSFWEIDLWGKLRKTRKAAYARFLASEKGRQLVQTSLIAEVAKLYYELLALDSELAILEKNIQLQKLAVELMDAQKTGGRATELAVQQSQAQLLNTTSLQAEKQQQIVATENLLNQLLGRFPQPITRGNPIQQQQLPATIQAGIPAQLLALRPDVKQAELELVAAKLDVGAARAAFLPSLTISPHLGLNAFKASLLLNTPASLAYGVLGGLTVPLLNQNQLKSRLKFSTAASKEAFYNYQKAILIGYQEVATGLSAIENFKKVAEIKNQEVQTLQNAVNSANALFAGGYATYLEIITAQKGVLAAELELNQNQRAMFQSTVDVYRALGGGWQ